MTDLIEQTIGDYRIETLLGAGPAGQVFGALHLADDWPRAVKVIPTERAADSGFAERFRVEIGAIAELDHPHVVKVADFGIDAGCVYVAMERLPGRSLRDLLCVEHPPGLHTVIDLIRQAADALAYVHSRQIYHLNLKPTNLLLARQVASSGSRHSDTLKVSDFALKCLADESLAAPEYDQVDTRTYVMSPERFYGMELNGRSDIYALGVILYEVTTGYQPFRSKSYNESLRVHSRRNQPLTAPQQVRPELPDELAAIIMGCLEVQQERRYASAAELSDALRGLLENQALAHLEAPVLLDTPAPLPPTPAGATSVIPRVHVLDSHGKLVQTANLTGDGLAVTRLPDGQLHLETEPTDASLVQIDFDPAAARVSLLAPGEAALLPGIQLQPHGTHPWRWATMLHIAGCWLWLEPSRQPDRPTTDQRPAPERVAVRLPASASEEQQLTIIGSITLKLDQPTLTIIPGQRATFGIILANMGSLVTHLILTFEGVPPGCVVGPDEAVKLLPNAKQRVDLFIDAPLQPTTLAGAYSVTVKAAERDNPAKSDVAPAKWTVQAFSVSSLEIQPGRARRRLRAAVYRVTVLNRGNTLEEYQLSAKDPEQTLRYRFVQGIEERSQRPTCTIQVKPGDSTTVNLKVWTRWRLIGRAENHRFTVHSSPVKQGKVKEGKAEGKDGDLIHLALITPTALAMIIALIIFVIMHGRAIPPPGWLPARGWLLTPTPLPTAAPRPTIPPTVFVPPTATPTFSPTPTYTPTPTSTPVPPTPTVPTSTPSPIPPTPTITLTPTPVGQIICPINDNLRISGFGPPLTPFLVYIGKLEAERTRDRAIGGGVTDRNGTFSVLIGRVNEVRGQHLITVRVRGTNDRLALSSVVIGGNGPATALAPPGVTIAPIRAVTCIVP